jgi:hypothetical protein
VSDTGVLFVTDDVFVHRAGNALVFASASSKRKSVLSLPLGLSLDAFAVIQASPQSTVRSASSPRFIVYRSPSILFACPQASPRIVCAVHGAEPQIHVYDFPDKQLVLQITGQSALRSDRAALFQAACSPPQARKRACSASLRRHAMGATWPLSANTVSGSLAEAVLLQCQCGADSVSVSCLHSRLSVWDLSSGKLLVQEAVPDDTSYLSFNPFNAQQLCTGQSKRLSIWLLGPYTQFTTPSLTQLHVSVDAAHQLDRQIATHVWAADG